MRLRVAIAADHGGFDLKQTLVGRLRDSVDLVDMGAREFDANDDYPDYVASVAAAVRKRGRSLRGREQSARRAGVGLP